MNTLSEQRLRWVSPLDPEVTEIARYSEQFLPYLARRAGVVAVEDGAGNANPVWWQAHQLSAEPLPGTEPLPIYHIGNNSVHGSIFERSREEPGLVVLHDLSLVDLAKHISYERDDPQWWKRQMLRQYGEEITGLVGRSENSQSDYFTMITKYPLFLPFVEDALGVIVHSRHAREAVVSHLPMGFPVRQLQLPARAPGKVPKRDYRARPLEFVFCGHVGPNRRLLEFFEAWGRLSSPDALSLRMFGNLRNQRQLMDYAERYGVDKYVEILGYVSDEELDKALLSAHFAINLRWPTMGEASASQLRYWAAGLPVLVTDVGWYGELPQGTVCKISVSREIDDIVELLQDAISRPDKFDQVGEKGWRYLQEHHAQEDYSEKLLAFAEQLSAQRFAHRALDMEFVGIIAAMCEDGVDTALFIDAVETAVATFDPAGMEIK